MLEWCCGRPGRVVEYEARDYATVGSSLVACTCSTCTMCLVFLSPARYKSRDRPPPTPLTFSSQMFLPRIR
ncbi:hypothetical protein J6590_042150 [Homalodisca vitripennis]|nr:hypothetical protein J6590_042145 [Homalodisca vitripennis]KAG8331383.1 hypothetical protein J6590_042150 [Homalodisca vitripennis]